MRNVRRRLRLTKESLKITTGGMGISGNACCTDAYTSCPCGIPTANCTHAACPTHGTKCGTSILGGGC
jgi:hypothetical protein